MMKYTGKTVSTADYAWANGIVDTDGMKNEKIKFIFIYSLGQYPQNMRSISFLMRNIPGLKWLSPWIPSWLKIPYWILHQMGNKF